MTKEYKMKIRINCNKQNEIDEFLENLTDNKAKKKI